MRVTKVLNYAMNFAEKLENHLGWKIHTVNTLFIGIVKASETKSQDMEIMQEVEELKKEIVQFGENASIIRRKMRESLPDVIDKEKEKEAFKFLISNIDSDEIVDTITIIRVIKRYPTKEIQKLILKDQNNHESNQNNINVSEKRNQSLEELVLRSRTMRNQLSKTIFGQNHAIQSFVDGLWNSELIAMSDADRKRPRGVFLFAGPPGVGKTYLAEEVAKEMNLPLLRLDMSAYSNKDANLDLTGFAKTWSNAKRGRLTEYVSKNPRCIVLFDEIEKAHLQVIHLFLQLLDDGSLTELYDDSKVSFKDVTVIFTTNAGRLLYDDYDFADASTLSKEKIIDAIRKDINPLTNERYFPEAILSRFLAGNVVMFNHLNAQYLEKVCKLEFHKVASQIGKALSIQIDADEQTFASLMYEEGGKIDARNLTSKTGFFLREEIKKLFDLFSEDNISTKMKEIKRMHFKVELDQETEEIQKLYKPSEKINILFIGNEYYLSPNLRKRLGDYNIYLAEDKEEALSYMKNNDVHVVILFMDADDDYEDDCLDRTISQFDYKPIGASDLVDKREELIAIHTNCPEIPIYIFETTYFKIDRTLETALLNDGARGIVSPNYHDLKEYANKIKDICTAVYMQNQTNMLKKHSQALHFETTPVYDAEKKEITIRLRKFSLEQKIDVDDKDMVKIDYSKTGIKFDDIIGADSAKEELKLFVDYLKNPKEYVAKGMNSPKGVLLYGVPGTGKTMLAKAVATEAGIPFLSTEGTSFIKSVMGRGAESIRALFSKARKYAPAIIFIDEIDTIARRRFGDESSREYESILNTLLTEMDGFKSDPTRPIFVLAATNYDIEQTGRHEKVLDDALLRRFDRKICVELPNRNAREEYISRKLKTLVFDGSSVMMKQIAERSIGMSLANLEMVIELAKRNAFRKKINLNDEILDEAFETIVHGDKKEWGEETMKRVARHEAGHAILSWKTGNAPSYITIVSRGNQGGYVQQKESEKIIMTKLELMDQIKICMAGRAAEMVYYGEEAGMSTGGSSDLVKASAIARNIICRYGMDPEVGLAVFPENEFLAGYSSEKVLKKINHILKQELEFDIELIHQYKDAIDEVVKALLDKNQLNAYEFEDIILQYD